MHHTGTSSAKFQNIKMGFYPDYPEAGDVVTINLEGTLSEFVLYRRHVCNMYACIVLADTVTEGRLQLELNYEKVPPIKKTYDLCYFLSLLKIKCPLKSGELHQLNVCVTIDISCRSN